MNVEDFRKIGKDIVDFICEKYERGDDYDEHTTAAAISQGCLSDALPENPPKEGEKFSKVFDDFLTKVMPKIDNQSRQETNCQSNTLNKFPFILGELLSSFGSIGCSWFSCAASSEMESHVLSWYAKALNLPAALSSGGGSMHSSPCEGVLSCLLAARSNIIKCLKGESSGTHDSIYLPQLTAYTSKDAHASIRRTAAISLVKLRIIETDEKGRMRADALQKAIENDIHAGLTPFFVAAMVTSATSTFAFNDLSTIGKICKSFKNIWLHIDGSYAGNLFILPEMQIFARGLEYADSFNVDPNELLLTKNDCSILWMRRPADSDYDAINVDTKILPNEQERFNYRHLSLPFNHLPRTLSLWFVFRTYGIAQIQSNLRNNFVLNNLTLHDLESFDKYLSLRSSKNICESESKLRMERVIANTFQKKTSI